jgi:hypothetical protein
MYETEEDLAGLQGLIDRTFARENPLMSMWAYTFHPDQLPP